MSKFIISSGFFNYVLFARPDENVFVRIFRSIKNLKMMLTDNVFTLIKLNCVVSPLLYRYEFLKNQIISIWFMLIDAFFSCHKIWLKCIYDRFYPPFMAFFKSMCEYILLSIFWYFSLILVNPSFTLTFNKFFT